MCCVSACLRQILFLFSYLRVSILPGMTNVPFTCKSQTASGGSFCRLYVLRTSDALFPEV